MHGHMNGKKGVMVTVFTHTDVRHPIQLAYNPLYSTR
jgi:hypothetical protein